MASAQARGAFARGKRVAFGDGQAIRWHHFAEQIFRYNPNVAPPGSEGAPDLEWIENYPGKRPYNMRFGNRWLWLPGHANEPGEIFFDDHELTFARDQGEAFVLIEPNVPAFKSVAVNKQWLVDRYAEVARQIAADGYEIAQFEYGPPYGPGNLLPGVRKIRAPDFRHALACLARAALFVGPEGGLHHGAAAVGVPAVVIFGGFIAPSITGYASHVNLFTGGEACGSLQPCPHCKRALNAIGVSDVYAGARKQLDDAARNVRFSDVDLSNCQAIHE